RACLAPIQHPDLHDNAERDSWRREIGEDVKRFGRLFLIGSLLGVIVAPPMASNASATGGFAFSCLAQLPVWPTSNGPAASCNGIASGYLQGTTTAPAQSYRTVALQDRVEWNWAKYAETCVFNIPTNGKANGVFSVRNMRALSGGLADGSWQAVWTRDGSALIGNLTSGLVSFRDGSKAASQRGTFVAHMVNFGPGLFPLFLDGCTDPQIQLTVRITGTAIIQN
ncbi:MAG: hypothetical protein WEB06_21055, partial [Actinomycetota bacterium]